METLLVLVDKTDARPKNEIGMNNVATAQVFSPCRTLTVKERKSTQKGKATLEEKKSKEIQNSVQLSWDNTIGNQIGTVHLLFSEN